MKIEKNRLSTFALLLAVKKKKIITLTIYVLSLFKNIIFGKGNQQWSDCLVLPTTLLIHEIESFFCKSIVIILLYHV